MAISRLIGEILLEARQANQALQNIQKNANQTFNNMARSANQAGAATSRSFNQTITQANRLQTSLGAVTRGLATLTAGLGLGLGVQQLTQASDSFIRLENRLKAATDTTEDFNNVFKQLRAISNETGTVLEENGSAFVRFNLNMEEVGGTVQDTIDIIETLSKSFLIYGTSTTEAIAGTRQLSQAFSSGRLQGDEFRSIMENLPAVGRALARVMGESVGDMRELSRQGLITADVILEAMKLLKDEVDATFSTITPTIAMGMQALRNEFTIWVGEAEKSTGVARALTEALFLLSENIDIAAAAFLGFIGVMGLTAIAGAVVIFASFAATIGGVATALLGLGALLGGVAAGFSLYNRAHDDAAQAAKANAAALKELRDAITDVNNGVEGATDKFASLARAQIVAAQKSVETARAQVELQQALLLQRLEAEHGIENAARMIREGDYYSPDLDKAIQQYDNASAHLDQMARSATSAVGAVGDISAAVENTSKQVTIISGMTGKAITAVDNAASAGNKALSGLADQIRSVRAEIDHLEPPVMDFSKMEKDFIKEIDKMAVGFVALEDAAAESLAEIAKELKDLKDNWPEFDEEPPEHPSARRSRENREANETDRQKRLRELKEYYKELEEYDKKQLEHNKRVAEHAQKIADKEKEAAEVAKKLDADKKARLLEQQEMHERQAEERKTAEKRHQELVSAFADKRTKLEEKLSDLLAQQIDKTGEASAKATGNVEEAAKSGLEAVEAWGGKTVKVFSGTKHIATGLVDEFGRTVKVIDLATGQTTLLAGASREATGEIKLLDEAMRHARKNPLPELDEEKFRIAEDAKRLRELQQQSNDTFKAMEDDYQGFVGTVSKLVGQAWGIWRGLFGKIVEGGQWAASGWLDSMLDVLGLADVGFERYRKFMNGVWNSIVEGADNGISEIKTRWEEFKNWFSDYWEQGGDYRGFGPLLAGVSEVIDQIKTQWNEWRIWFDELISYDNMFAVFSSMIAAADAVIATIQGAWTAYRDWFNGLFLSENSVEGLQWFVDANTRNIARLQEAWIAYRDWFNGLFTLGSDTNSLQWFVDANVRNISRIQEAWIAYRDWFNGLFTVESAQAAWDIWYTAAQNTIGKIQAGWTGYRDWMGGLWESIAVGAKDAWARIESGASNTWTSVKTYFAEGIDWTYLTTTASQAWETITAGARVAWEVVQAGFTAAWDVIKNFFGETLGLDWSTVVADATDAWDQIKAGISNLITELNELLAQLLELVSSSIANFATAITTAFGSLASNIAAQFAAIEASVKASISNLVAELTRLKNAITAAKSVAAQAGGGDGYSYGGPVWGRGTATSDSIPARLSRGEYVIRAAAVRKYGKRIFDLLNTQRFAAGGFVATPLRNPGAPNPGPSMNSVADLNSGFNWIRNWHSTVKHSTSEMNRVLKNFGANHKFMSKVFADYGEVLKINVDAVSGHNAWVRNSLGHVSTWIGNASNIIRNLLATVKRLEAALAKMGEGKAGGGLISGAGTSTSDSIFARLSRGEYVIRAAAVRRYGTEFFDQLNRMALDGFNMGGVVDGFNMPVLKYATGGYVSRVASEGNSSGTSNMVPLNLTIFGESFEGLLAPEHTASQLVRYSVGKQNVSTGNKPWWYR